MKKSKRWLVFYCATIVAVLVASELGSRTVTAIADSAPIPREHCIIIDPGHGGEDGGATSCTGIVESVYNLDTSLRLNDLFHLLGYETKIIRTTDISVYTKGETIAQKKVSDLKERVRITNETENALLLSIHQNNYPDSRYSGVQVFYAPTEGSEAFAKQLQSSLMENLHPKTKRDARKSSGVYLMEHIRCPAVLIECGFLSNPEEEAKLRDSTYQKKMCCVIAATVSRYLQ